MTKYFERTRNRWASVFPKENGKISGLPNFLDFILAVFYLAYSIPRDFLDLPRVRAQKKAEVANRKKIDAEKIEGQTVAEALNEARIPLGMPTLEQQAQVYKEMQAKTESTEPPPAADVPSAPLPIGLTIKVNTEDFEPWGRSAPLPETESSASLEPAQHVVEADKAEAAAPVAPPATVAPVPVTSTVSKDIKFYKIENEKGIKERANAALRQVSEAGSNTIKSVQAGYHKMRKMVSKKKDKEAKGEAPQDTGASKPSSPSKS